MSDAIRKIESESVGKRQFRASAITEKTSWNADTRELSLAFASELPVSRWYGTEILSCRAGDVDLVALNNRAALLEQHDPEMRIGGVMSATVGADSVCRAVVKVRRDYAKTLGEDIEDGIPPKVSVGYELTRKIEVTEDKETGLRTIRWAWRPVEISLVSVPADDTVGIGRASEPVVVADEHKPVTPAEAAKETRMSDTVAVVADAPAPVNPSKDAAEIVKLGRLHNNQELAERALSEGMSLDAFRAELLAAKASKPASPVIGLDAKEVRRYSFLNVINALAGARVDLGFERECSDAVAAKIGRTPRGLFVPYDVQIAQRDLQIASAGTGSAFVATQLMPGSFIDALHANLALQALGVPIMSGLVGDIAIPKGGIATGYWVDETTAPTESTPTLAQVTGSPNACGTYIDISRKLLKQSSVDIEAWTRNAIARALAKVIDQAAFNGGGTTEPTGLLTGPLSTDVSVTAGTPTYAEMVNIPATVEGNNVMLDNCKWAVTSEVFWKLAATATSTNGPKFIADYETGRILGKPAVVSSNVTANYGIFGDWSQMILAMWGNGLDLNVDTSSGSTTGLVRVVGFMDVDILIAHAEAFAHADICS